MTALPETALAFCRECMGWEDPDEGRLGWSRPGYETGCLVGPVYRALSGH